MQDEEWRPVIGTSGAYEVSNSGGVRSYKRIGSTKLESVPHLVTPLYQSYGYLQLQIWDHGKRRVRLIHRLVMEAFVGPCPDGMEVAHKDGNKQNNRLENIRYCTRIDNMADVQEYKRRLRPNQEIDGVLYYQCTRCQEWKSREDFGKLKSKTSRCGIHSACRVCSRERGNELKRLRRKLAKTR